MQLEPGRLIPAFQHPRVMLHDVNRVQLGVALELNSPAHFATGVTPISISPPSGDAASRTNIGEQGASGIRESRLVEPTPIGIIIKPNGLREKTTRTDVCAALLVLYEITAEIGRFGHEKCPS
jgi:hypothetical protein